MSYLIIIEKIKTPEGWKLTTEQIIDYFLLQDEPVTYLEMKICDTEYEADLEIMKALDEGAIEVRKAKEVMVASGIDRSKLA